MERLKRLWDKRWSFKESRSHSGNQMDLNDLYIGPKLQIETKYAAVLTLIFVDMTYSATMVSTETVRFMRKNFLDTIDL